MPFGRPAAAALERWRAASRDLPARSLDDASAIFRNRPADG